MIASSRAPLHGAAFDQLLCGSRPSRSFPVVDRRSVADLFPPAPADPITVAHPATHRSLLEAAAGNRSRRRQDHRQTFAPTRCAPDPASRARALALAH